MSNVEINTMIQDSIAAALKAQGVAPKPAVSKETLEQELARLQAEHKALSAPRTTSAPVVTTAAEDAAYAKGDAKLLQVITKFASKPRADKKPSGTFAVKVHAYFHACGIPEETVRKIIASGIKRNVISKMGITTKNGTMILYFDAKVRPNNELQTIDPSEKSAFAAAFGIGK